MPSRTPNPRTWASSKLSKSHVADYKPFSMVDGVGVRCSVYLSGCPFQCEGCFNTVAQSFRYGEPYTPELKRRVLTDLGQPYVRGLSLLGGEPFLNTRVALDLALAAKVEYPDKDIWAWTGYTVDELMELGSDDQMSLLRLVDVLVDGRFERTLRDPSLRFRGSSNQRVLDVTETLACGRAVTSIHGD